MEDSIEIEFIEESHSTEEEISYATFELTSLSFFKKRAEPANSVPYQTKINAELRKVMGENNSTESLDETAENLLANRSFISALKDKLKAA